MTARLLLTALALALAGCATVPPAPAPHANPVIDADFPDPAVLRAADGFYYVYATQGLHDGRQLNIQAARSRDLVHWQRIGDALPVKPAWAARTQDFWAPHVHAADGRYFLYYSARPDAALTDTSRGLCLAVAVADRPEGPFTDIGAPLQCGEGFVNIDPMAYDDPATGKRLLYWGSGFGPIKVQELAPDGISFAAGSRPIDLLHVDRTDDPANYRRLIEGAWVVRRDGYYYLFYSGDNCCGPNAHYALMVARSRSATGPFETRAAAEGPPVAGATAAGGSNMAGATASGGTNIAGATASGGSTMAGATASGGMNIAGATASGGLGVIRAADARWNAPGHNAVVEDAAGRTWSLHHAVDRLRPRSRPQHDINTRRVMLRERLVWRGGWPEIERTPPG